MISFSTCWNSRRHSAGDAMVREIKIQLGFESIELGQGIRAPLVPGIQKMCDSGEIRISSLHNFCPSPIEGASGPADCYKFSAESAGEREAAVTQTLQTIDFAARLNASLVVLHLGQVHMSSVTDSLIAMAKAGKYLSREYVRAKIGAVLEREKVAPKSLRHAKECLKRVIEYAASKNVRIGLESRRDYEQMPTERELAEVFEEMNFPQLGYWHDFGHSQIKENLGFIDHAEWLRMVGSRAFGCHLQDCVWPARDHLPPFTGSIDFEKLVPLLPANGLFVWEMNSTRTADEIRESVQMWKERFGE